MNSDLLKSAQTVEDQIFSGLNTYSASRAYLNFLYCFSKIDPLKPPLLKVGILHIFLHYERPFIKLTKKFLITKSAPM